MSWWRRASVQVAADDSRRPALAAFRATTVGTLALVSLHAFEALALTTVMPTIARGADGDRSTRWRSRPPWPQASSASLVGQPRRPARARPPSCSAWSCSRSASSAPGLAPTMPVLVGARFVQGLGAGMTSTALYVAGDARLPAAAAPAILAASRPPGWCRRRRTVRRRSHRADRRLAMGLRPRDRRPRSARPRCWPHRPRSGAGPRRRCPGAGGPGGLDVLAVAVLVLNLVAERLDTLAVGFTVARGVALGVVVATLLPLLPRHPAAGRGLPTDVPLRALAFAASPAPRSTAATAHRPRRLAPSVAGSRSTLTGVSWFVGSWVQGAWDTRFEIGRTAQFSLGLLMGTCSRLAVAVAPRHRRGWSSRSSRCSDSASARSTRAPRRRPLDAPTGTEQGFVSSALQIGGSTAGAATALALSAVVFAAVTGHSTRVRRPTSPCSAPIHTAPPGGGCRRVRSRASRPRPGRGSSATATTAAGTAT